MAHLEPDPLTTKLGVDFRGSPKRHAFFAPAVSTAFQFLNIGAALRDAAGEWHALHSPVDMTSFEFAHGRGLERGAHNDRSIERALRTGKTVFAKHAGLCDFFVPVTRDGKVEAVLVSGPLATRRPTATDVLERWRWLTGQTGHLSDPSFFDYLTSTLNLLTLEKEQLGRYRRFLGCLAMLVAERGDARQLALEAAALHANLEEARFVDRMWDSARRMIDERTARSWFSQQLGDDLARIRLKRLPERVLVGLFARVRKDSEPVAEFLKRDAFQRACVELALGSKSASGKVGDSGVMFLVPARSGPRGKDVMTHLRERLRSFAAKRFGLELHFGESSDFGSGSLSDRYAEALGAAERATSQGVPALHAEPGAIGTVSMVRELRSDLSRALQERPKSLVPRFERYIDAVLAHGGYRLDLVRVHLETGFDLAARALLSPGTLSERSYVDLSDALERSSRDASTLGDVLAAYRLAISNLVEFAERPVEASQHGNLQRAVLHIQANLGESLRLRDVARIAGFAPSHFAKLFKERERATFGHYIKIARIERAKELLQGTDLSADRVGQLSGFALRHYFHRVFKAVVGMTPMQYRKARPKTRRRA